MCIRDSDYPRRPLYRLFFVGHLPQCAPASYAGISRTAIADGALDVYKRQLFATIPAFLITYFIPFTYADEKKQQ